MRQCDCFTINPRKKNSKKTFIYQNVKKKKKFSEKSRTVALLMSKITQMTPEPNQITPSATPVRLYFVKIYETQNTIQ